MKGWMKKVLNVFPVEWISEYLFDWLERQAKKTPTLIDDKAVQIARIAFDEIFIEKKKEK